MILVSIKVPIQKNLETFNDPRINETIQKESGNLFNEPRINKSAHIKKSGNLFNNTRMNAYKTSLETYLMIFVSMCP